MPAANTTLADMGRQELFAWLQLAQQDLDQATSRADEVAAEKLCDQIVDRLMALA